MADNRITQASLTSGEISESLYGRKDLAKRAVGVKKLENMTVHATGGASNRAGLRFVGDVGGDSEIVRLMRFESAADEAYLTVWKNNEVLPVYRGEFITSGSARYSIPSPYSAAQISGLYMDQSNDIATITHPEMPIRELGRYGVNDWRFNIVDFSTQVSIPVDVKAVATNGFTDVGDDKEWREYEYRVSSVNASGEEGLPSDIVRSNALVFGYSKNYVTISWKTSDSGIVGMDAPSNTLIRAADTRVNMSYRLAAGLRIVKLGAYSQGALTSPRYYIFKRVGVTSQFECIVSYTAPHVGGGWKDTNITPFIVPDDGAEYYVGFWAASSGNIRSRPWSRHAWVVGTVNAGSITTMTMDNGTGSDIPTRAHHAVDSGEGQEIIEYIVYKGKNGVFGSIGRTPNTSFKDDNIAPDMTQGPVQGKNPFDASGKYPSMVFFSQQRRGFAHTNSRPQTIWMSTSANYRSMNTSEPSRSSDAIEFTLAAERKQDVFHVVSLEKGLIVFTRSGEWKVTGRDGDILAPDSIFPMPQSRYGSNALNKPLVVGESLLFVSRTGNDILSMEYSFDVDRYKASDLTLLSQHLFKGKKIVSWDYAEDPDGIVYCVMNDGTVNSLTYLKEHDVVGWSTFKTSGKILDVAVVSEGGRDVPYFVSLRNVNGTWRKHLEFLENRIFNEIEDAFFVDSGLSYDVPKAITAIAVGASTLITSNAHGLSNGDIAIISGNDFTNNEGESFGAINGRFEVYEVTTNNFKIKWTTALEGSHEKGDPVNTSGMLGLNCVNGILRRGVDTFSGLNHLEGRRVVALCDGAVVDSIDGVPLVVSGGALPRFPDKYGRAHIGLSYSSTVITLDLISTQGDDTGIVKSSGTIIARFEKTRGVKYGTYGYISPMTGSQQLIELIPRDYENYGEVPRLRTGLEKLENTVDWDEELEIIFVQDQPLPFTLTGITIEYDYGGS